ncbi:MAG TPA: hypothetical protein GX497_11175 [Bacillus bacterium]|nr:hypothetical protein [Bacillus sp. (in: firmicutes)]
MKTKNIYTIALVAVVLVVLLLLFLKPIVIFSDSKVLMLDSNSRLAVENSYIDLIHFKLEDEIVRIDLVTPLGNFDDYTTWKEDNKVKLYIANREYPLFVNISSESGGMEQGTTNYISLFGEVADIPTQNDTITLKIPVGKMKINYVEKHKLYY